MYQVNATDFDYVLGVQKDPEDWATYGNGYANRRYSVLDEIHIDNVARLVPKWIYQTGILGTFPTNPIVSNGIMYLSTPYNHVVALDAATGKLRWRYTHQMSTEKLCCGTHNRGIAIGYGRLYMITADGRLIALDATNGEIVWDIPVIDPATGNRSDLEMIRDAQSLTPEAISKYTRFAGNMAPVVFDRKVFVGVSGAGYTAVMDEADTGNPSLLGRPGIRRGQRAFMSAYDAVSGRLIWRWYSTAAHGWEGEYAERTFFNDNLHRDIVQERANTAKYADAWKTGGGSIYSSPSIDPSLGLIYFGTGNAAPGYAEHKRPGDNLHTSSLIALDLATGKLSWYHQITPHDIWGYDVAAPPVLFDIASTEPTPIRAVGQASKSGWLYVFDRVTGKPIRRSKPFVPIDDVMFRRPTQQGIVHAPGAAGGANWPPVAHSSQTGWLYIAASHRPTRLHVEPGEDGGPVNILSFVDTIESWGTFTAIDPTNGEIAWQTKTNQPLVSGSTATAGGLVFYGQSNGDFVACNALNGEQLWSFNTGAGVNAPPISYQVSGKQFIAVAAGGHRLFQFPLGNAVIAFGLAD